MFSTFLGARFTSSMYKLNILLVIVESMKSVKVVKTFWPPRRVFFVLIDLSINKCYLRVLGVIGTNMSSKWEIVCGIFPQLVETCKDISHLVSTNSCVRESRIQGKSSAALRRGSGIMSYKTVKASMLSVMSSLSYNLKMWNVVKSLK